MPGECSPCLNYNMGEKFEDVSIDYHTMKPSYMDGETWVFMDQESFEQYELTREDLGEAADYMLPERSIAKRLDDIEVEVGFYEGKPVSVTLPINIVRTITYCEPGIKGDSVVRQKADTSIHSSRYSERSELHLRQVHQARQARLRLRGPGPPLL